MPDYALMNQYLYEGKAKEVEQMTKDALAEGRHFAEVLADGPGLGDRRRRLARRVDRPTQGRVGLQGSGHSSRSPATACSTWATSASSIPAAEQT